MTRRSPAHVALMVLFACASLLGAPCLLAQEASEEESPREQRERAERAVELLLEAEALLEGLPLELLEEVERRVAAGAESRTEDSEPTETRPAVAREEVKESTEAQASNVASTDSSEPGKPESADDTDKTETMSPAPVDISEADSESDLEVATSLERPSDVEDVSPVRWGRQRCEVLQPLDSDDDGWISGADRWWRYLFLWNDANGDGNPSESEIVQPFEVGVRRIASRLDRYEGVKELVGDVRLDGSRILLSLPERRRRPSSRMTLVLDAERLARRDGPTLAFGETAETTYPVVRPGLVIHDGDRSLTFGCD